MLYISQRGGEFVRMNSFLGVEHAPPLATKKGGGGLRGGRERERTTCSRGNEMCDG